MTVDRVALRFAGPGAGRGPLTWGQKAIRQDMRDSGNQFSMGGMLDLAEGSTVADAALLVGGLMSRHAALRARLVDGGQEVAAAGETGLDVLTLPDEMTPPEVAAHARDLMDSDPLTPFDFGRDWPLRASVVRHRSGLSLVWTLSHLVADGGAHLLLLADLLAGKAADPSATQLLDIARDEDGTQLRQLSKRAVQYWAGKLRDLPAHTFGEPVEPAGPSKPGERHRQARFSSPAAHLAVAAIARRTGTDVSRVTLAVIATAVARATGVNPLTVKVMVSNRFRPGLAEVVAPVAQNSLISVDLGDTTVDAVVARVRGAMLTAGMRAYYDPDDLAEVIAGMPAPVAVTARINDQRRMVGRGEEPAALGEITPEAVARCRDETALTWLGPRENMHEQLNLMVENEPDRLSLLLIWDTWSLTDQRVEALLREVEEVAVAAAFDPAAPTGVAVA